LIHLFGNVHTASMALPFTSSNPGCPGTDQEHWGGAGKYLAVSSHPGGAPAKEKTCESAGSGEPSWRPNGAGQDGLSAWLASPNRQSRPLGIRAQAGLAPASSALHTFPIETRLGCTLCKLAASAHVKIFLLLPLAGCVSHQSDWWWSKESSAYFFLVTTSLWGPAFCSGDQKQ